ncbi:hypothetical protein HDV00_002735 [Rhizophlyctis rosea]|nr:hypothetical protein HDV00_002735 [Rhizophlyctis rosea]
MTATTKLAKFTVRKSEDRGHANHGWLDTYHTFSFASYYDDVHTQFGSLRVLNEDRVTPTRGFGTHPHANYEILSYVISGAITHKDSLGNIETIPRGGLQFTSAGTGVRHSEYNESKDTDVHFLQLWFEPIVKGLKPTYQTREFGDEGKRNTLVKIMEPTTAPTAAPEDDSVAIQIHADAHMYASILDGGNSISLRPEAPRFKEDATRKVYVHVVNGSEGTLAVSVKDGEDGVVLHAGDGVYIEDVNEENEIEFRRVGGAGAIEFVVIDSV